jgi:hypothetical protein
MHSMFEFMDKARDQRTTQAEAAAMVETNVQDLTDFCGYSRNEARKIVLHNIGYFAGYYDHTFADRVYSLFQTEHPIFGLTHPTPKEASRLEMEYAAQQRRPPLEERNDPMPGMPQDVQDQNRTRKPSKIGPRNRGSSALQHRGP